LGFSSSPPPKAENKKKKEGKRFLSNLHNKEAALGREAETQNADATEQALAAVPHHLRPPASAQTAKEKKGTVNKKKKKKKKRTRCVECGSEPDMDGEETIRDGQQHRPPAWGRPKKNSVTRLCVMRAQQRQITTEKKIKIRQNITPE
jgi:hypothetical protein